MLLQDYDELKRGCCVDGILNGKIDCFESSPASTLTTWPVAAVNG